MAVLNNIRKRSGFLIVIIALALFSFVLADVIQSGGFSGSRDAIAKVNGKEIPRDVFMNKVEMIRQNMGQAGNTSAALDITWNDEIKTLLYGEQYELLGLTAQRNMINEIMRQNLGSNPSFLNESGQYDPRRVQEYVANIQVNSPELYFQWNEFVKELGQVAQQIRYENLVKSGLITTIAEGRQQYKYENDKVSLDFAFVPYTSIEDSEVEVTEAEINTYLQKHADQFQVEASAAIEYVAFVETASAKDESDIKMELNALLSERVEYNPVIQANDTLAGFIDTKDHAEFVNANSAVPFQDVWYSKEDLPVEQGEEIFSSMPGTIVGPYKIASAFVMTKVLEEKQLPGSVKASHILLTWEGLQNANPELNRTKEEAKALADSLHGVIKSNKSKFAELALTYSEDYSNNEKAGDLDYFKINTRVKPLNDFVFENPIGSLGVVETQLGYHIVSVEDQKDIAKVLKLANIIQPIEPSEATIQEVFSNATKFEVAAGTDGFNKAAEEQKLSIKKASKIGALDSNISGFGENRAIVTWLYEKGTKVGDFKRFDTENGYVFIKLTSKNERGIMPVYEASAKVTPILRNKKKAEMIRNSVTAVTLEDFAAAKGLEIESASAVTRSNPRLPEAGKEPAVVGIAFGTPVNTTSKLVDGESGVFMLKTTDNSPAKDIDNYNMYVSKLNGENQSIDIQSQIFNTLKNKAKIEDFRATFY